MNTTIFEQRESEIRGYCRMYPTVFSHAQNARQTSEDGKSYIDFFAGAGVLNFGHNPPEMKKAVIKYLESDGVIHSLDMYTCAKREFMEAFVKTILVPRKMPHKLQFMGPTGTNAVEAALKIARRVTGRQEIVAFSHGFHGMTLGSLALTANSYFRDAAGIPMSFVRHVPFEGPDVGLDSIAALRKLYLDTSSGLEKPAAFVLETIQAEGGVNVGSAPWLKACQDLAKELGALFIIDEIQVGCGRTGSYFSFDGMGLDPDVVILAKGIGGFGTPLAMNLVKAEHDQHWNPGEHTGTFRGQNLSFVAGREALRYFENDTLMEQTRKYGQQMQTRCEQWATLKEGFEARGKGMIQALDMADGALAKAVAITCFENGLILSPCGTGGRVLKLIPPLTIPQADLDEGLDILEKAIKTHIGAAP